MSGSLNKLLSGMASSFAARHRNDDVLLFYHQSIYAADRLGGIDKERKAAKIISKLIRYLIDVLL